VHYVDFGTDNFAANAARVVQDVPLFVFTHRRATGWSGCWARPNVGGIAEPFTGVAAR